MLTRWLFLLALVAGTMTSARPAAAQEPSFNDAAALQKAHAARAFGADYIANILLQQQCRREVQPPLRLKDPELNQLATDPLSLAEYDAFILRSRKESRDATSHETEPTQPDDDEPPTGSDDL